MLAYLMTLDVFSGDYFEKYKNLILENQKNPPSHKCTQKHHIIPRHVFEKLNLPVNDSLDNLVTLSCIDHFLAHIYLAKSAHSSDLEYANYASAQFILTRIDFSGSQSLTLLAQQCIEEFIHTRKIILSDRFSSLMSDPVVRQTHDDKMRTPEVREKISKSMLAYRATHEISADTKKKLAETQSNKVHINKNGEYRRVNKCDLEAYLQDGWQCGGLPITSEHHRALAVAKFKPVYCIVYSTNECHVFESTKAGAEWWQASGLEFGTNTRGVSTKIKKSIEKNKIYNGVQWFYC